MHDFMIKNAAHVKHTAEHALFPLHLLAINHHVGLAAVVAAISLTVYALATIYLAKNHA